MSWDNVFPLTGKCETTSSHSLGRAGYGWERRLAIYIEVQGTGEKTCSHLQGSAVHGSDVVLPLLKKCRARLRRRLPIDKQLLGTGETTSSHGLGHAGHWWHVVYPSTGTCRARVRPRLPIALELHVIGEPVSRHGQVRARPVWDDIFPREFTNLGDLKRTKAN